MAMICVIIFFFITTTFSMMNTTLQLYIYYNDTNNFIDTHLELFEYQFDLSLHYAIQNTINNDLSIDTNICSYYHHRSSTYLTNQCSEPSDQWMFTERQLTANSAKAAISLQIGINISSETIVDIILNPNSTITQDIEHCMNKHVKTCLYTNYESSGNFDIILIQTERITMDNPQELDQRGQVSMYWLNILGTYLYDFAMYGIMFICLIIAITAWIHAGCKGYDCINITAVVIYAIYTWDFYADVVFCAHLMNEHYFWLSIISGTCVVIPLVAQFGALLIYQNEWIKDELIKEKISGWLMRGSRRLWVFAFISGSTYGAIELLNSNIFALQFFSMGLTKKHLSQFNSKRLLTNILLENIPQLAIQSLYMFKYQDYHDILDTYSKIDIVLLTAFISSLISIFTALLNLCATRKSFKIRSKDEYIFWMCIEPNTEIEQKFKQCIYRRKALAKGLRIVLNVDIVEIALSYKATEGIVIAFSVFVAKNGKSRATLTHKLNAAANFGALENVIQQHWNLKELPIVNVMTKSGCIPQIKTLSDIKSYGGSRSRKSVRTTTPTTPNLDRILTQLSVDLDGELFAIDNDGTPRLSSLDGGTPRLSSNRSNKQSSCEDSIDIYALNAILSPGVSGSPTMLEEIDELEIIDTEPYAI